MSARGSAARVSRSARTVSAETKLADLNRGYGVATTSDLEQFDASKMDSLRIVARNGVQFDVDLSTATSLQDVVNLINSDPLNNFGTTFVNATVRSNGNGIELTDSSVPTTGDLQVLVVGGTQAAEYLKLVAPGSTQNSSHTTNATGDYVMSGGNVLGHDLVITARDGTKLWVDLAGATTIQHVIDRINAAAAAANNGAGVNVTASLAATGNGIQISDASAVAGTTTIAAVEGSSAAQALGFVPAGQSEVQSTTGILQSEDRHTLEVDSVFNTLLRLKTALEQGDVAEISRSLERLDADMDRANFARAELGGRLQSLDIIDVRLEDENVQLRAALSEDLDVDLVKAISDLTARQFAFEASLRTAGSLMQMSLLNFI
jgi:flagellin-like hook-associated protein FlgL